MSANGSLASEYTLITVHNCASPTYTVFWGSNVCSFFWVEGLRSEPPCTHCSRLGLCTREVQRQLCSHTKFVSLSTVRHPLLNLVIAIITLGKKCVRLAGSSFNSNDVWRNSAMFSSCAVIGCNCMQQFLLMNILVQAQKYANEPATRCNSFEKARVA